MTRSRDQDGVRVEQAHFGCREGAGHTLLASSTEIPNNDIQDLFQLTEVARDRDLRGRALSVTPLPSGCTAITVSWPDPDPSTGRAGSILSHVLMVPRDAYRRAANDPFAFYRMLEVSAPFVRVRGERLQALVLFDATPTRAQGLAVLERLSSSDARCLVRAVYVAQDVASKTVTIRTGMDPEQLLMAAMAILPAALRPRLAFTSDPFSNGRRYAKLVVEPSGKTDGLTSDANDHADPSTYKRVIESVIRLADGQGRLENILDRLDADFPELEAGNLGTLFRAQELALGLAAKPSMPEYIGVAVDLACDSSLDREGVTGLAATLLGKCLAPLASEDPTRAEQVLRTIGDSLGSSTLDARSRAVLDDALSAGLRSVAESDTTTAMLCVIRLTEAAGLMPRTEQLLAAFREQVEKAIETCSMSGLGDVEEFFFRALEDYLDSVPNTSPNCVHRAVALAWATRREKLARRLSADHRFEVNDHVRVIEILLEARQAQAVKRLLTVSGEGLWWRWDLVAKSILLCSLAAQSRAALLKLVPYETHRISPSSRELDLVRELGDGPCREDQVVLRFLERFMRSDVRRRELTMASHIDAGREHRADKYDQMIRREARSLLHGGTHVSIYGDDPRLRRRWLLPTVVIFGLIILGYVRVKWESWMPSPRPLSPTPWEAEEAAVSSSPDSEMTFSGARGLTGRAQLRSSISGVVSELNTWVRTLGVDLGTNDPAVDPVSLSGELDRLDAVIRTLGECIKDTPSSDVAHREKLEDARSRLRLALGTLRTRIATHRTGDLRSAVLDGRSLVQRAVERLEKIRDGIGTVDRPAPETDDMRRDRGHPR